MTSRKDNGLHCLFNHLALCVRHCLYNHVTHVETESLAYSSVLVYSSVAVVNKYHDQEQARKEKVYLTYEIVPITIHRCAKLGQELKQKQRKESRKKGAY